MGSKLFFSFRSAKKTDDFNFCLSAETFSVFNHQIPSSDHPSESSSVSSDLFSCVGTVLLWVCWPSFNAILAAEGEPFQRAVVNTHLAMLAAVAATFVASALMGE